MDLPSLRHFKDGLIYSDLVEVLVGEAWVRAVLCRADNGDQYWATPDMVSLSPVTEWRHGQEDGQGGQGDGRVQARDAQKRQTRSRQGSKGQKPQAGNSNCSI